MASGDMRHLQPGMRASGALQGSRIAPHGPKWPQIHPLLAQSKTNEINLGKKNPKQKTTAKNPQTRKNLNQPSKRNFSFSGKFSKVNATSARRRNWTYEQRISTGDGKQRGKREFHRKENSVRYLNISTLRHQHRSQLEEQQR